ncbi:MAG: ABC transporter permease [Armatimonadetes bacterium]|nr:ABC transporter permease [Armatimonadota bacterium]
MDSSTPRSVTVSGAAVAPDACAARRRKVGTIGFFFRHHRLAAAGGLIVALFVLAGALAPVVSPFDPDQNDVQATLALPNAKHWLGTDHLGRDLLSRVIYGGRMSLYISFVAVGVGGAIGIAMGTLAGFYRRLDAPLMRLNEVLLAFPGIVVALTAIAILGRGLENLIAAIAIVQIPQYARLAHGLTLAIRDRVYVEAAVAIGAADRRILGRYILPNTIAPMIVQTTLLIPGAIMTAATMSFLGLGVTPPTAEWGAMLQNSLQWSVLAPHIMIVPGLALMLVVLGFNLFGDGLRDVLDPRLRQHASARGANVGQ